MLVKLSLFTDWGWSCLYKQQLCAALSPSQYCCLLLKSNVTAVTQNSCPQKVYSRGPASAYHLQLPAQCHIYLSCCSGLLKVSRAAVVACKGETVILLPPDYFSSFEGFFLPSWRTKIGQKACFSKLFTKSFRSYEWFIWLLRSKK